MIRTASLLARLNPKGQSFGNAGFGGVPERTPADIAAALSMVPPGLGRELLCHVCWEDAARRNADQLDQMLMAAQLGEWRDRADALITAQLMQASAGSSAHRLRRAEQSMTEAKAKMWPALGAGDTYAAVRRSVLSELRQAGGGEPSNRDRAKALDIDEAAFRRTWSSVYLWTLEHCLVELEEADRAMYRACH